MLEDYIVCAMKDVSAGEAQLILSILPLMCKTSAGRRQQIFSITL